MGRGCLVLLGVLGVWKRMNFMVEGRAGAGVGVGPAGREGVESLWEDVAEPCEGVELSSTSFSLDGVSSASSVPSAVDSTTGVVTLAGEGGRGTTGTGTP